MEHELEVLKLALKEAGKAILNIYYNFDFEYSIDYKADDSPITIADKTSHNIIMESLSKLPYPILSEESVLEDHSIFNSEYLWIIDPLDGTMDFIQHTDEFSVMIGLLRNNIPVLGGVYVPIADTLYWGVKDNGTFRDSKGSTTRISVSSISEYKDIRIVVSRNHLLEAEIKISEDLGIANRVPSGSAGIKLCKIAEGNAELYINSSNRTGEWDLLAGLVILQEAGGSVTDLNGEELEFNKNDPYNRQGFIASNNTNHGAIIDSLSKYIVI